MHKNETHRTIQHILPLVSTFLDVALQSARVERLQKFETAQQLARHGHDRSPVIELAAVLHTRISLMSENLRTRERLTLGAENTVTSIRSV